MTVTLDWIGCATFRLSVNGFVIFLDTFMDRISTAPGSELMTSDQVTEADFALIGHAHFDHLAGADVIAQRTGARVIGSHESARVLREAGVPEAQLIATQGGDRFLLSDEVSVRVFPSLHSCTWSQTAPPGTPMFGDYGVPTDERLARAAARRTAGAGGGLPPALRAESEALRAKGIGSRSDGGALDYLIETPEGSIFFQDSMGSWSGVLRDIRADVAILAASGRANVDGEPIQGAVEDFIAREVEVLKPRTVVLGHHDNWQGMPDEPDADDITPVRELLARVAPKTRLLEVGYLEGTRLF